ncbi:hypothetical protein KSP40_PGU007608 [Platanthera guangdongensis]|uniref:Gnk2-homologous domain-containing protein n=1 Tax=Platanthera guangdongensis TaxID=2320717 RepID=A0ABR2MWL8_9ASPA
MPLLVLFLVFLFPVIVSSQDELNFIVCSSDLYPSGSPFESALRFLLNNLTALPPKSPFLYSSFSSSLISGFAQCRPDSSIAACANCLLASSSKLANVAADGGCGRSNSAVAYQDLCIFRYSNENISASLDESIVGYAISVQKASSPANFSRRAAELMGSISWDAAMSPARFAAGAAESGGVQEQRIYGMVWCKLDLMTYDCFRCLLSAAGKLPFTTVGGRVYEMSCLVRFEVYTFVDPSFIKSPTTSPKFLAAGVGKENVTTPEGGESAP